MNKTPLVLTGFSPLLMKLPQSTENFKLTGLKVISLVRTRVPNKLSITTPRVQQLLASLLNYTHHQSTLMRTQDKYLFLRIKHYFTFI